MASGGSCGSGALAGAVGSALSPLTNTIFPNARTNLGERIGGTIVEATAGGLASVAGGGKFANGAITAAFGYLFNEVAGTYSRRTGQLTLTDLDTGETFTQVFRSGSSLGAEIPAGEYAILERSRADEFRLEALDGTFGDDRVEGTGGRGLFRWHGPGTTNGCIAACDIEGWEQTRNFINGTTTTNAVVNTYKSVVVPGGFELFRWRTGTETLRNFGKLTVQ